MRRRTIISTIPVISLAAGARADDKGALGAALDAFRALPGTTSFLIEAGEGSDMRRFPHQPDLPMFIGSAFKTFVLAQFLREVESGRLTEEEQLAIDDAVRSPSSPVFLHLTGTTPARSVLEAMITHSDNTATDVAMDRIGADRVRDLVTQAGLRATRVPTSTRRFFSWLCGAAPGTDLGWAGVQRALAGTLPGQPRPALNETETLASSASDMVGWYRRALQGGFFAKPETLTEFKRIQAMADAIARAVPPDTVAYGKGGSIVFNDFNCYCFAGQMIPPERRPVTFCFTVNWTAPESSVPEVEKRYIQAVSSILRAAQNI